MKPRSISVGALPAILALATLSFGPAARAQIPKTEESPYAAPRDQALLVFSRPRRRQASDTGFRVLTHAGRCVAVLENGWQMTAPMWPGKHMLVLVTGMSPPTTQLIQVNVSAGKTYVVNLHAQVSVKRPIEVEVLRRGEQPLQAFPAAVREILPAKPDLRPCSEWVSWKRAKIEPRAEQSKQKWDEASEEFRESHTVHRRDGWTATEIQAP